jgi:hypothetical protein
MTRRRKLLVTVVLAIPIIAYGGWCGCVRLCYPAVEPNTLVGKTESQLRITYGSPDKDWQGYQSLAWDIPPSLPSGPIRTLIFHPCGLFHPEGGTLWVWVTERDGEWVCFESCWFEDGVEF